MRFCRINRLGQKISIPILLAERLDPFILLGSTLIPAAAYASIYKLYLLPRKKRALKDRVKDLREEHKEFIRQKRQEARDAVDVMERSVEAKLAQERDRNGMSPSFFFFFFAFSLSYLLSLLVSPSICASLTRGNIRSYHPLRSLRTRILIHRPWYHRF